MPFNSVINNSNNGTIYSYLEEYKSQTTSFVL